MTTESKELNLAFWNSVERTDPAFTQQVKQGSYEYTSIDSYYLVKKATEAWGPIGVGLGFDILESRFDDGPVVKIVGEAGGAMIPVNLVLHTAKIGLWYKRGSEVARVEHFGHTEFISMTKWGPRMDAEAPKKSVTDGLKKCLSMVGFSADVYMDMFSDQNYFEESQDIADLQKADNRVEEKQKQIDAFDKWFKDHHDTVASAASMHELEVVYKIVVRKLAYRREDAKIKEITRIKDKRKAELGKMKKTKETEAARKAGKEVAEATP